MVALGAVSFSDTGVALAVSLFYLAFAPLYSYRVFRKVGVSVSEVAGIYLAPVAFAALAAIGAFVLGEMLPAGNLAKTIVIGLAGGALYLALLRLFVPQVSDQLWTRAVAMVRKRIQGAMAVGQV